MNLKLKKKRTYNTKCKYEFKVIQLLPYYIGKNYPWMLV